MSTIGCVFITHNAKHHLPHCLPPLLQSPLQPKILVVNSSSSDGTIELAQSYGVDTLVIPRTSFNHGATRELARKHLATDIIVMMTPDAYMVNSDVLKILVQPLINGSASASYARQIPHSGATFFESFPRAFNYPSESHVRSIADLERFGVYTYFCSDSCAAYNNSALEEVGGFPHVLLGEDTVVIAKMLHQGHKVAYVAEARVHHSHKYSLGEEFRRNFDTGLARKGYEHLLISPKGDSSRGLQYVRAMNKELLVKAPHLIPYGFLHIFAKWIGYRLGRSSHNAPLWVKRSLSSQDFYWIQNDP